MIRAPLRRRTPLRRTTPLRAVSRTPPTHRDAYTPTAYTVFKAALCAAWGYRCGRCRRERALDCDHVVRRSQGGADSVENCWPLCRPCHADRDVPFARGRLCVEALGGGVFRWAVVTKADKSVEDPPSVVWTTVGPGPGPLDVA